MNNDDDRLDRYNRLLLEDVKSIYHFQYHLINGRAFILGATLALLGAIITYTLTKIDSANYRTGFTLGSVHLLLLGIAYSTIRIMGAMNRAGFAFGAYLDAVQEKVAGPAFWHCLWKYLEKGHGHDTITHAFAIGVKQISYAMSFYVWASSFEYLVVTGFSFSLGCGWVIFSGVAAAILAFWTWLHVPQEVDPTGFGERRSVMKEVVNEVYDHKVKAITNSGADSNGPQSNSLPSASPAFTCAPDEICPGATEGIAASTPEPTANSGDVPDERI